MSPATTDHAQLFARIRVHGVTKSINGTPCPIDLERKISFPMPADYTSITAKEHDKDLSPLLLAPKYDVEARSATPDPAKCGLGAGRAGVVYPLEILSFKPASNSSSSSELDSLELPILPQLCIKIATPGFVRNLAREAWVYEQLDSRGLTGFVTPRCYGVFHSSDISDEVTVDIPGFDYYRAVSMPVSENAPGMYTAQLSEELYNWSENDFQPNADCFMDDQKRSYTNSEWRQFRETPEVTTMTVLVMDMLGERLTLEEFEKDWMGEINDIWDHFVPLDILHRDVRFPNVLRVPPHLRVPCPLHPTAGPGHRWNITDWESAEIICIGLRDRKGIWEQRISLYDYYREHGGSDKKLRVSWRHHFAQRKETGELVYISNPK